MVYIRVKFTKLCPLFTSHIYGLSSGYIWEVNSGHEKVKKTLIYPVFDVESIGDVPRVLRTHLDVVFAQTIHV